MTTSNSRPSSVVLGAGLMGRLLAWQLTRAGHAVTVYEAGGADALGSPARIAAAMIAPLAESAVTEASVVDMGRHSLQRWPELLAQLSQPVYFQREGTLILWHRQDAAEAQRFARELQAAHEKVPALPQMQAVDGAGVTRLEPSLGNRFTQGLYLPGEAQIDGRQLLAVLLQELQTLKVELHWNSPRAPQDFKPGTAGQPDWVFDCRGLGAQAQWPQLRGIRGEVARIHAPEVSLSRPTRLIHPRYAVYIAPKPDHVFVIGATEIESDDLSPPSVRSTLELLSAAYSVHSGFAEARILEISTQCRPTLPDNLPAIRRLGARTLQINGMYRHGFMISPALLDSVLELVREQTTTLAQSLDLHVETVPS